MATSLAIVQEPGIPGPVPSDDGAEASLRLRVGKVRLMQLDPDGELVPGSVLVPPEDLVEAYSLSGDLMAGAVVAVMQGLDGKWVVIAEAV